MTRIRIYTEEERKVRHKEASRRYAARNVGYSRKWAIENKEKKSKSDREWYLSNSQKVKSYIKEWQISNPEKVRSYHRKYESRRLEKDVNFKLAKNLRIRIRKVLVNNKKVGSAVKDLGCTLGLLKTHLEMRFTIGMRWDNYGKWHIDHITPLSSFDLTNREQFLKACHYTNLQPLWALDNIQKSNKIYGSI